ncbi:MAG: ATP-binding protein [Pseudonocardiaceae bacterium]
MGRARELAWLGERAAEARSGAPRLVVVEGEAGIGKTSLLRRFLSGLDGFTVLAASGDKTETPLVYGVLTKLITATPTPVRSEFPLLSRTLVEHTAPFAVGAEFLALLGEVQSSGPVAVVVEDLHWADRGFSGGPRVHPAPAAQRQRAGPRHCPRGPCGTRAGGALGNACCATTTGPPG